MLYDQRGKNACRIIVRDDHSRLFLHVLGVCAAFPILTPKSVRDIPGK